jgi:hypothetical protein
MITPLLALIRYLPWNATPCFASYQIFKFPLFRVRIRIILTDSDLTTVLKPIQFRPRMYGTVSICIPGPTHPTPALEYWLKHYGPIILLVYVCVYV